MAALYYIGRMDGRGSQSESGLEDLIVKEVTTMTTEALRSEAVRCGTALTKRGTELQEIGARISKP
jgi:hypothetical protein